MNALLRKMLFTLAPETAHNLVKSLAPLAPNRLLERQCRLHAPELTTQLGDQKIDNPVGLAAGFDKNAEIVPFLQALGFGFLELGSVTDQPSEGNPRPRIFRLTKDQSLINRMGLPNWGAERFVSQIANQKISVPYGVNIAKTPGAKNGVLDICEAFSKLSNLGCYTVINLSCPNTSDGKTFEDPQQFEGLAKELTAIRKTLTKKLPLLVKLSPDNNEKATTQIVECALKFGFDGFVVSNTSTSRDGLNTRSSTVAKIGRGGLSGKSILDCSTQKLRLVHHIAGKNVLLIGVGGIMNLSGMLEKFAAGAQLIQIYTGFVYGGPFFVRDLNCQLIRLCQKNGIKNFRQLIGDPKTTELHRSI